jgi:hypothetical protein
MARSLASLAGDYAKQVAEVADTLAENGHPDNPTDEAVFSNMVQDLMKMRDSLKAINNRQVDGQRYEDSLRSS